MVVKVHFLNWEGMGVPKELLDKGFRIFMNSLTGTQETFEKDCYRTHEIELDIKASEIQDPESFLEMVYAELNSDTRPNGAYERSMCAGDVVEFENKCFIVLGIGFSEIATYGACPVCNCTLHDTNIASVKIDYFEDGETHRRETQVCEDCHDEFVRGEIDLYYLPSGSIAAVLQSR